MSCFIPTKDYHDAMLRFKLGQCSQVPDDSFRKLASRLHVGASSLGDGAQTLRYAGGLRYVHQEQVFDTIRAMCGALATQNLSVCPGQEAIP